MRMIALAAAALALSACGGSGDDSAASDANALGPDNLLIDDNLLLDSNLAVNGTGVDANGAVDSNTANLMMKDATTNDADTNLANGL